jgi:hypothetical protein
VEVILASVVVVVVVVVVVEIISTLVAVAIGRGGDCLDTGSSSCCRVYREISCSESVLGTTNCPLVLACSGLEDGGHFQWSLYTFRIQSVFLLFIKYTHDYPHGQLGTRDGSSGRPGALLEISFPQKIAVHLT